MEAAVQTMKLRARLCTCTASTVTASQPLHKTSISLASKVFIEFCFCMSNTLITNTSFPNKTNFAIAQIDIEV